MMGEMWQDNNDDDGVDVTVIMRTVLTQTHGCSIFYQISCLIMFQSLETVFDDTPLASTRLSS